RRLLELRAGTRIAAFRTWSDFLLAWLDRRPADMLAIRLTLGALKVMDDPEGIFQEAWLFCDVGEYDRGLRLLELAVANGYFVIHTLTHAAQFDALRGRREFQELLVAAEAGRQRAERAFRDGGGERL